MKPGERPGVPLEKEPLGFLPTETAFAPTGHLRFRSFSKVWQWGEISVVALEQ